MEADTMDRNKKSYKKIMYVFALLIMVISQLGIATVFAEEIASNKGNTLKLSLDKSEYTKNEEIQVNIEGKEERTGRCDAYQKRRITRTKHRKD